jgi:GNAT superfamily N-acetyltransferase
MEKRPYSCLTDFTKVYDFMVKTYEIDCKNGKPATAFEYAQLLYWTDHSQNHRNAIWEDSGVIVGLCWYDSKIGEAHFNLMPGYEKIIPDMLNYCERRLSKDDGSLQLKLYKGQLAIIEEIQKRGYKKVYESNEGIYDFSKNTLNYELPEGYYFKPFCECDKNELQEATWRGFNNTGIADGGVEKVHRFEAAPHRTSELDVIIVTDNDEYVCYGGMWYLPENKLAYLEPFCTVPEHRKKGLAAAALSELVKRTKPLGATPMTGGDNEFYFKVGFEPLTTLTVWERKA